jgi:hypothetical protein
MAEKVMPKVNAAIGAPAKPAARAASAG